MMSYTILLVLLKSDKYMYVYIFSEFIIFINYIVILKLTKYRENVSEEQI